MHTCHHQRFQLMHGNTSLALFFFIITVLFSGFSAVHAASVPQSEQQQAINASLGDAIALGLENALGLPSGSNLATGAGLIAEGDIAGGLWSLLQTAADYGTGTIPVVGQFSFAVQCEEKLLKAAKSYLDTTLLEQYFTKFKSLDSVLQEAWLRGEDVAEMNYYTGDAYVQLSNPDYRQVITTWHQAAKQEASYQTALNQLAAEYNKASSLLPPEAYGLSGGTTRYHPESSAFEWFTYQANYFVINVTCGNYSAEQTIRLEKDATTASCQFSSLSIPWETALDEGNGSAQIQWRVRSARVDTTGLFGSLMPDHVAGAAGFIVIPNHDTITTSAWYSVTLEKVLPASVSLVAPTQGSQLENPQVTFTVRLQDGDGIPLLPTEINKAGVLIGSRIILTAFDSATDLYTTTAAVSPGEYTATPAAMLADGQIIYGTPATFQVTGQPLAITLIDATIDHDAGGTLTPTITGGVSPVTTTWFLQTASGYTAIGEGSTFTVPPETPSGTYTLAVLATDAGTAQASDTASVTITAPSGGTGTPGTWSGSLQLDVQASGFFENESSFEQPYGPEAGVIRLNAETATIPLQIKGRINVSPTYPRVQIGVGVTGGGSGPYTFSFSSPQLVEGTDMVSGDGFDARASVYGTEHLAGQIVRVDILVQNATGQSSTAYVMLHFLELE